MVFNCCLALPCPYENEHYRTRPSDEGSDLSGKGSSDDVVLWLKQMAHDATYKLEIDSKARFCAGCFRPSVGLKVCSRCESVRYCSDQCQKRHWTHGHKEECISPEIPA
ncbi:hypothetical protein SISSUDRAFT_205287 [Sistotremastrum suecicum HHB10207 ss-3]|uniref:MYND-type domain-containing protein n=1 Tax=Sistotremastrum suecicum HHB10207 ss-3 TaxID=1314776 RepID=A0A166GLZ2_9AGAM|nr:hypothetical protein SISSUDRAFT_205287 [Sistotremastrum suecicum HHB10207 ss-3]